MLDFPSSTHRYAGVPRAGAILVGQIRQGFCIRCGIGRPPGRMPVADFVLSRPRREAKDEFEQTCGLAAEAVPYLIENGLEKAQQEFN